MPSRVAVTKGLLSQIVQVSADAIFSEDLHGCITSWNAAAERLYGRSAEDMLGRSADDLLPAETTWDLRRVHDLAMHGERVERFDSWHLRPDGRRVAVSLTVSPLRLPDGEIAGIATSVQDVTDRVELAAELDRVHSELEKQFEALGRSNRDLAQFAYVASHDLSEPLRVMTGFVQLLEKRYSEVLDERGLRYIEHVVDGAARMRVLIDDLLQFASFLRTSPPPTRVEPAEVARKVLDSLGTDAVEIGPLPAVWCDEPSVAAVLQNLLSNALKFHRPGTSSRVMLSGSVEGDRVTLVVDDDGIGIGPEHRQRVFGMFSRLHTRESFAGSGIGLAIVQQIAERRDGTAWVEESPLGGSRFCITLPASETDEGSDMVPLTELVGVSTQIRAPGSDGRPLRLPSW
jgi:PAS domain S-box-containing protein